MNAWILSLSLSLSLLTLPATLQAQPEPQWDASCVVANDGCGPFGADQVKEIRLQAPDCFAEVTYKIRTCSTATGTYQDIVIVGWTLHGGCGGFDVKSYFHQNYDGLKEYVILGLLSDLQPSTSLPECPASTTLANVYSASCGVWVCCEYTVDPASVVCETGWSGPPPHYGTSPTKVKSCKWQPCGTACCRRTYSLCFKSVEGYHIRDIQLVGKEKIGPCSGESQYSKPCQDGC